MTYDRRCTCCLGAVVLALSIAMLSAWAASECNEAICASIISKCMLTQSCKCDLKQSNCSCCRECYNCLNHLFLECCSCVDMCPKANETSLNKISNVEEFLEPMPTLFNALTIEPDSMDRWITYTFPVNLNFKAYSPKLEKEIEYRTQSTESSPLINSDIHNCTVVYYVDCMSNNKCRENCRAMGASSYRWFHNACCECVGENCLDYGINESRCKECSLKLEEPVPEEEQDYNNLD